MIYLSDYELDALLLEDIRYGDLTTRALGIGARAGTMTFSRRQAGTVSGLETAARLLRRLGLRTELLSSDGAQAQAGQCLLAADGSAEHLHQGWKVAQNLLEWCGGVAQTTSTLVARARQINPGMQIAVTRKSIPGTKALAMNAVLDGGGLIHRCGTAETILLFANHRSFCDDPEDWRGHVATLRHRAPERTIVVEVEDERQARAAALAGPDMVQLDKFLPEEVSRMVAFCATQAPNCRLAIAGGINQDNITDYARTGIGLAVTSVPYYSKPVDISVELIPAGQ